MVRIKIALPPPPTAKMLRRSSGSAGKRAPSKPKYQSWSCFNCKSMSCIHPDFVLEEAIQNDGIPKNCVLRDPNYQSERARMLMDTVNGSIVTLEANERRIEAELAQARRDTACAKVSRKRQLDDYYENQIVTIVQEKKKKKKSSFERIVPGFKGVVIKTIKEKPSTEADSFSPTDTETEIDN